MIGTPLTEQSLKKLDAVSDSDKEKRSYGFPEEFVFYALMGLKDEYINHYPDEAEEFTELIDKWFPFYVEDKYYK